MAIPPGAYKAVNGPCGDYAPQRQGPELGREARSPDSASGQFPIKVGMAVLPERERKASQDVGKTLEVWVEQFLQARAGPFCHKGQGLVWMNM